ncbi:hypothetical protein AB0C65_01035 [Nocardia sp. NPDC048505]|uniref:hypothetical protein n=1 Tax=Nocardia sp. NPDC048505 TaxID=3155756 RepID=UPI003400B4A8
MTDPEPGWRRLAVLAGLAVAAAASWAAWLGWDSEYYYVDGVEQGPYRPVQVIGCGACVVLLSVAAFWYMRRPTAIPAVAAAAVLGFAVPWSVRASADSTGLWAVGLLFLLVGGGLGLVVVLTAVHLVRTAVRAARELT